MSNEFPALTKEELAANPSIIGEKLAQLALEIEDTKSDLNEIRNRGFWKRLTNNNVRDLAEAMIKQNDTISAFLIIVQGIIFLSMNNLAVLGGVMDALTKAEETNEARDSKFIKMAKDFLAEAMDSAKRVSAHEDEINNMKAELAAYSEELEKQDLFLSELHGKLDLEVEKRCLALTKEIDGLKKKLVVAYALLGTGLVISLVLALYVFFL